jgi:uncharacterized membrane protein HdeD (DUF308 family)
MFEALRSSWQLIVMRGLVALLFGILALVMPSVTIVALAILFGLYAVSDGLFSLITGFTAPAGTSGRGSLVLKGLVSIAIGAIAFFSPGFTALSLVYLLGIWALLSGAIEIGEAIMLRDELANEWLFLLGGAITILFGLLIFKSPASGALFVAWLVGAYAVAYGLTQLMFAFEMKHLKTRVARLRDGIENDIGRFKAAR